MSFLFGKFYQIQLGLKRLPNLQRNLILAGIMAFLLLYFAKYKLIERSLIRIVAIMGVVFIASAVLVKPDYSEVLKGIFVPVIPENGLVMIMGLIGTTVVPYNLFLHSYLQLFFYQN